MDSVWTSDDITFCTSDCDDMECERNSKHIHHHEIPHSYADLDGDKRFCRKVQDDEKEYQPGVWYDMDVEAPANVKYFVLHYVWGAGGAKVNDYCFGYGDGNGGINCAFEDLNPLHWMIIPEPPKE